MPLTDALLRTLKANGQRQRHYDTGGLYIEVPASGNPRWRIKYRVGGQEKLLSLGVYPTISLKQARTQRDDLKQQLAQGIDPSLARKATRSTGQSSCSNSFETVAREWLLKQQAIWSVSHWNTSLRRLERDVFPWLGAQPIDQIRPKDVLDVLKRVESRGAVETAHRLKFLCGQVFCYAVATCRAENDPTMPLRGALTPVMKEHMAAVTDPERLGEVLRMLEGYRGTFVVCSALRLMPLVFVRPGELRQAQWADIDFAKAEWRFTLSKTKQAHIVPLSRQAIAILKALHPLTGHGRYVFPNPRSAERPMSENAVLAALRGLGIHQETTGHGFRATARTLLEEVHGFRPEYIEQQLGHQVRDPLGRAYNRTTHLRERREMMQTWADYLDELRTGEQPSALAA